MAMESILKRILVVDDSSVNLKTAEEVLQDFSKPILVPSGEMALRFLSKNTPDLILLDINMPGMDGFEVMEHLQYDSELSKVPVIFLTADKNPETEVKCLKMGAVDFINKPFEPEIMVNRIRRTLEIETYRKDLEGIIGRKTEQIERMQREVIISIANLIENRDGSTGEHVKRTSQYVELLINEARRRGLYADKMTDEYVYNVVKAAPMHDIGKITIPDNILQKPGKLTKEEFEVMKSHTVEGGRIIKESLGRLEKPQYIKIAFNVARSHHEKWNGAGYPDGKAGDDIPLEARIMAIADVFDALVSKRCYKGAIPVGDAYQIISDDAGNHFDPVLAGLFVELRPQVEEILARTGI